jgi:thiosulfate/3-mercaptopyruvate sulfurtransferase
MSYANPEALIDADWLAQRLTDPLVAIIDASFHLPAANRDGKAEFQDAHIPGAVYFDINEIADGDTDLPHMLSSPELFADKVGALGIGNDSHVICYDANGGAMAAMRAWWMLRIFGHQKVSLLNGGLLKWRAEGRPVTSDRTNVARQAYKASFDPTMVRSRQQILGNIDNRRDMVVDVRSAGRYNATEPEPREGMRGGHIPGSVNLPFADLLDGDNHNVLRAADDLGRIIKAAGISRDQPIVASCGSGVTAAVLAFSLYLLGDDQAAVYDGSWTEWGGRDDTPIET